MRKAHPEKDKTGALGLEYAEGRRKNRALSYRLKRRTQEADRAAKAYLDAPVKRIIDLGTADGRMLAALGENHPAAQCVGVEYNHELSRLAAVEHPGLQIVTGDVEKLAFGDAVFDLALATAVVEHLPDPGGFMSEVRRILRPGGLLVLTAPDPFWEEVAHRLGHLKEDVHHMVMNLKQLSGLARARGLEVLLTQKFMVSPVGLYGELALERLLRRLGLGFLLLNQLMVARRPAANSARGPEGKG